MNGVSGPSRSSKIDQELIILHDTINGLIEEIGTLRSILTPIIRSPVDEVEKEEVPPQDLLSHISESVREAGNKIRNIRGQIRFITDNIDL